MCARDDVVSEAGPPKLQQLSARWRRGVASRAVCLYVGYLLVQHIWSVLDSGDELFLLITLFCIFIWLGRHNKDSFYSLFKDIHQSNLDDIAMQKLEEEAQSLK